VRTARKRTGSRDTLARIDLRVDLGLLTQLWQVIFPLVKLKKGFYELFFKVRGYTYQL